uniref:J domain-containing protein n=1 Tax=Leersia perrieri TaxID=77586 RepID=A0A0D9XD20_9ORYZ
MNATVEVRCGAAAVFGHGSSRRRPASGHCRMIIRAAATTVSSWGGGACSVSDYYKVLSLERERPEEVGAEEIRRAYRRLALRYHPDACANDPSRRAESTRLFLELRRAYETLSDPALRVRYDAALVRRRRAGDAAAAEAEAEAMARDVWEAQLRTLRARSDERRHGAGRSRRGRWFEM